MAENNTRREWRGKHHTRTSKQLGGGFSGVQLSSKTGRMFALGCIALVSGVVGATITGQVFAYKIRNMDKTAIVKPAPAEPKMETSTVLVATRALRFGDKVDSAAVRATTWIAGTEPAGSFKTLEEFQAGVDARAALGPIEMDEPILAAKVTGPGERPTLSALVGDSKRALTVPVDEVFGVAGFILPGDRVDVMLTRTMTAGDPTTSQADVLVQNVKVLAIDQQADQRLDAPSVSSAVTLEVDTEMAQKLALGGSIGRLSLTLRAAGSAHRADVGSVSLADLAGDTQRRRTMTIVRGVKGRTATASRQPAATPVQVPAQVQDTPTE
ncbi:Flp pilus assembly protein CpaB [Anderseniella sp. Alg231-50]|uniref:Flp pilus assembly protein CpaB n=1 Tax=Anderseniella sp. Alg231-50 TaxID=1922226 RepID=UPI000D54EDDB